MSLVYGGEREIFVKGYSGSSFQIDSDNSKSQCGWVFILNGGAMTSKSPKQETPNFTYDSEYIIASELSKETT